jgi:hypothetical protein
MNFSNLKKVLMLSAAIAVIGGNISNASNDQDLRYYHIINGDIVSNNWIEFDENIVNNMKNFIIYRLNEKYLSDGENIRQALSTVLGKNILMSGSMDSIVDNAIESKVKNIVTHLQIDEKKSRDKELGIRLLAMVNIVRSMIDNGFVAPNEYLQNDSIADAIIRATSNMSSELLQYMNKNMNKYYDKCNTTKDYSFFIATLCMILNASNVNNSLITSLNNKLENEVGQYFKLARNNKIICSSMFEPNSEFIELVTKKEKGKLLNSILMKINPIVGITRAQYKVLLSHEILNNINAVSALLKDNAPFNLLKDKNNPSEIQFIDRFENIALFLSRYLEKYNKDFDNRGNKPIVPNIEQPNPNGGNGVLICGDNGTQLRIKSVKCYKNKQGINLTPITNPYGAPLNKNIKLQAGTILLDCSSSNNTGREKSMGGILKKAVEGNLISQADMINHKFFVVELESVQ